MSSLLLNEKQKHEIIFTNRYKNFYKKDTSDNTSWFQMNRGLAQNIMQLLKDPSIENMPLREWIKEQGFLLGGSDKLCVCVEEGDGPVAMTKSWKQVAVVEDYFDLIWSHHFTHSDAETTYNKLAKLYHGIPFDVVEAFVSSCPECQITSSTPTSTNANCEPIMNGHKKKNDCTFMRKGQVEFLPVKDSFPEGTLLSGIGVFMDTWSNYHILFPLVTSDGNPAEFATVLAKRVYPYYGIPRTLSSSMGCEFVEELIKESTKAWPDAVAIGNRCKKLKAINSITKRADRSKHLISQIIDGCGQELNNIELSSSAAEDLLLSIQYKLNILINKKSHKCPYELVFGQLPMPGPHTHQMLSHRNIANGMDEDSEDTDGERAELGTEMGGVNDMVPNGACLNLPESEVNQQSIMNRIAQKTSLSSTTSSGKTSHQQLQHMLATGTIQAQEQQVTSLRELLRQEENRLEMLKQMRSGPNSKKTASTGTVHVTGIDAKHGVIRSTHGVVPSTQEPTNVIPISSRLQQLVDSVAVNQISSQATQLKSSIQGRSNQSKASSLPQTTTTHNGIQSIQKAVAELDEATILKTIENSSRYREFVLKQSALKRNFQKQIDKKIGSAAYPKTFRQVWPIIPVNDAAFIKNIGLETVTTYFDPAYSKTAVTQPTKIKPTCNQCGCDFASAWQIRKNNSKQVLLCEACDFTNLKLFQRSKLATQLKELMDEVRKGEEKFNMECEEAKQQTVALEKAMLLNPKQQQPLNIKPDALVGGGSVNHVKKLINPVVTNGNPHIVGTSSAGRVVTSGGLAASYVDDNTVGSRKRKSLEEQGGGGLSKVPKTSTNLDRTLSKISQQLIQKQVVEKVGKRKHSPSNTSTTNVISSKVKVGPPPLKQANPIDTTPVSSLSKVRHTPSPLPVVTAKSTPPPLVNSNNTNNSDSRKSRRKGTPRHKIMDSE